MSSVNLLIAGMHLNILIASYRNACYKAAKSFKVGDLVASTEKMGKCVIPGYVGMITRMGDIGCEIIWYQPNYFYWSPYMAIKHLSVATSPFSKRKQRYELAKKDQ